MKKTKLTIVFAAIALALSGCNIANTKSHEHHFNSQWSHNDNFHWHACDSCDEVKDKAEHSFGEWHIEKEATEYELGSKYRLCIDCEYKQVTEIEKLPHTHKFSSTWESDDNYHWHVCTECHEEDEKIAHTYDDGVIVAPTFEEQGYTKYTCSICEHIKKADFTETLPHSFSDEWKYDSTGHWHPCLDEGYEEAILNKEPHSYSETIVPATSEEQGYTIYTCECGYTYNDNFVNLFEFDTLSDETISLKAGEGARLVEELIIPTSYKGKTVSSISASGFENLTNLKVLRISSSSTFKTIETKAFQGCTSLAYVVIPETIKTIKTYAFNNCNESLMIYCEAESQPDGYSQGTNVNYRKDKWSGNAEQVWYGMSNFYENDEYLFGVTIYDELSISRYKGNAASIIVPDEVNELPVVSVGQYAFANKKKVVHVKVQSPIKSIGEHAFDGCSLLAFACIPESVTTIGNYAFYECNESLMIYCGAVSEPDGYGKGTNVNYRKDKWSGSADQVWWDSIGYIVTDDYLFGIFTDGTLSISKYYGSEKEIQIPNQYEDRNVVEIGQYSFYKKNRITKVAVSYGINRIGAHAFDGCSVLAEVTIAKTVTKIGRYAFYQCSSELIIYCGIASEPSGYDPGTAVESYKDKWSGSAKQVYFNVVS